MTAAYLESVTMAAMVTGSWAIDLTQYIVSSIKCSWGINGNGPLDKIASTGEMEFVVNNIGKEFTQGSPTFIGLVKGAPVRLRLDYDDGFYYRFYGRVEKINIMSGPYGKRQATITCSDWMDVASNYPIILAQSQANLRADQAVQLILYEMPIKPQETTISTTNDTFSTVFDTVKENTTALSEFAKLMISEYGYLYLRKGRYTGENLVVEARHDRDANTTVSPIPVLTSLAGDLLLETGDYLLLEDGFKLVLDETEQLEFSNLMTDLDAVYGDKFSNYVSVKTYPRRVGSLSTLFTVNSPIYLTAGQTKSNIKGAYTDPNGGGTKINGSSMVAPVASTDYKMYANSDGTGTDLTAFLSVSGTYGTEAVQYSLTNTSTGTAGYVTLLQARGYPVYTYNAIAQYIKDDTSILQNGYKPLNIDQKYSTTLMPNIGLATIILSREKDARIVIERLSFIANTSPAMMFSFLNHDVGSLIKVVESQTNTNAYYFIQDVEFEITVGGIVTCSWGLTLNQSTSDVYWMVETVGNSELGVSTFVGY